MFIEDKATAHQHTQSMYDNTVASLPSDIRDVYERMTRWFASAPMSEGMKNVDETVSDVVLTDSHGVSKPLSHWLEEGPAIFVFFRSDWCDFCSYYIDLFHRSMPIFKASKAQFFAITPETTFATNDWRRFEQKGFHIISDPNFEIIQEFHVDVALPQFIIDFLHSVDIDPPQLEQEWRIPLTGVFIVNEDQKVAWRLVSQDYRYRPSPNEVLNAINQVIA